MKFFNQILPLPLDSEATIIELALYSQFKHHNESKQDILFIVYKDAENNKKVRCIADPKVEIFFTKPEYRYQWRTVRKYIEIDKVYPVIIEPRKKYPDSKNIPKELLNEIGWALCVYGDYGWGQLVKKGKYDDNYFSNKLVDASCNLLLNKKYELNPEVVVYVPSLNRNELVRSLACRIAEKLNIPCFDLISKTKKNLPQKNMENSKQQYENIKDCFELYSEYNVRGKSILLVDDMVDSKWTLTICGILLKQAGAKYVYPYVLASTAGKEY